MGSGWVEGDEREDEIGEEKNAEVGLAGGSRLNYLSISLPVRVAKVGIGMTYRRRIVTAKAPLACMQYPFSFGLTGAPQDFVIYHGAPD